MLRSFNNKTELYGQAGPDLSVLWPLSCNILVAPAPLLILMLMEFRYCGRVRITLYITWVRIALYIAWVRMTLYIAWVRIALYVVYSILC